MDLEITGEDALKALWLEDSTDILDTELTYELHPNEVDHNDDGMRLVMAGRTMAEPHPCVADFVGENQRAGADGVLTYYAMDIARWLKN